MITYDTIVCRRWRALGISDRRRFACQGYVRSHHEVFTGVCITTTEWQRSFAAQTGSALLSWSEEELLCR